MGVPNATRQTAPPQRADPLRSPTHPGSQAAACSQYSSIARLQGTVGNRAINRLLKSRTIQPKLTVSHAEDESEREADRVADQVMRMPNKHLTALQRQAKPDDDPLVKTKKPTGRASMLLTMFWHGATNTGLSFTSSFEADFNTASNDPDARVETIPAIRNGANVTYTFITNKKTGFIYVREKHDATDVVNYYQAGKAASDAATQPTSNKDDKSANDEKPASRALPKASSDSLPPALAGRTIQVSGGQVMIVYGVFQAAVQTALADGWLSFLEMSALWKSGKHLGTGDEAGHDMMEMLTQRALPPRKGSDIKGLTPSELATWSGSSSNPGVIALGSLNKKGGRGLQIDPYQHYFWNEPDFGRSAGGIGPLIHVFNMNRYLNEIAARSDLAPDDTAALQRLMRLYYVIDFPAPTDRGIGGLPVLTPAQIAQCRKLLRSSEPDPLLVDQLARGLGIPE